MARIQVASNVVGDERVRSRTVLSRWASRYLQRRSKLTSGQLAKPASALIENTLSRQFALRDRTFQRRLPFSWSRFFVGLVSLVLVFSDIFRGGLGVSKLDTYYPSLHPEEALGFGTSWNYSVFAATKDEAYSGNTKANVWTYKFDSTSITWRAFATYLKVSEFPDCLLYKSQCPGETIDGNVAFRMVDAVVDSVKAMNHSRQLLSSQFGPVGMTLRTESDYIDRFHQFLLPKWFTNFNWRTNQALHYSPELLEKTSARSICFPSNGAWVRTPHFCDELWINLDRSCAAEDLSSRAAGLLYVHTINRLREIQARFPNTTVDLTFLESQEDLQVSRGGLSFTGFRRSDVSTIIRARNCSDATSCDTVFLEDYRYETGLLLSDIVQWYRLVAALRATGQINFWLRGIGLMLSCYFVHGTTKSQKKQPIGVRLQKARDLFMKVPTQCVVYGSSFPVLCYVIAHLLDAPFTYNVLESHFFSQAGVLSIKPEAFVSYAVVQMRSVWIYALAWHSLVSMTRSSELVRNNEVCNGVTGVPEFLLSAFSSVTLIAQYRSTTFRSSNITKIIEIPSNIGRAWEAVKYQYSFLHRGRGSVLLGGVIIDLKFLICLLFFVVALWAVRSLWMHFWVWKREEGKHQFSHWFLLPPTPVPYSAGVLWPIVSVCVQWPSAYYCIRDERPRGPQLLQIVQRKHFRHRHPILSRLSWNVDGHFDARVIATNGTVQAKYLPEGELCIRARPTRNKTRMDVYRFIQHKLKCVHRRSDNVEANVAFMNAVLMSDPLVFLSLKFGSGHASELAYYQSIWHPQQILLLPVDVVGGLNEFTGGLKMLRRVNTSDLTWSELVQCG